MKKQSAARIGRLLGTAYSIWQRETYAALLEQGFPEVRPSHSPVFRFIDPEGTRVVDLSARAGIAKQSMTYLVRSMEEKGLVEILPDQTDGRARLIVLTQRGEQASAALVEASLDVEDVLSRKFGPETMESLRSCLAAMVEWDFAESRSS